MKSPVAFKKLNRMTPVGSVPIRSMRKYPDSTAICTMRKVPYRMLENMGPR
jgi:hypothetical protein